MLPFITRILSFMFGWLAKIIGVPVIDMVTLFKTFLRWSLLITFVGTFTSFIWIISNLITSVYQLVTSATDAFASQASSNNVGCVFHMLGLDTFLTSAIAAFYSSASLYVVIVISWYTYIITRGIYLTIIQDWMK